MKKLWSSGFAAVLLLVLCICGGIAFESIAGPSPSQVEPDPYMRTKQYQTKVVVGEDGSYDITERIHVKFSEPRHGIYRYVPNKGTVSAYDKNGVLQKVPYYAPLDMLRSNETVSVSSEKGNKVFRFGDEDTTVWEGNYKFEYLLNPKFQKSSYDNIYCNIFPTQWKNEIPAGSRFTIKFPKKFNMDRLKIYYGEYGSTKNAEDVLTIDKNEENMTVTGTLKKSLPLGSGLTCFAGLDAGYFEGSQQVTGIPWMILIPSIIIFGIVLCLFLMFGRDEKIIPSIQYQPPDGLDSAGVGYIIDGKVQDQDLLSLILYWADRGYLKIEEKKGKLIFHKKADLASTAPGYQRVMFDNLFDGKDKVKIDDLKYKYADTLQVAKNKLIGFFGRKKEFNIYTTSSRAARGISLVLSALPLGLFMLVSSIYSYTGIQRMIVEIVLWILVLGGMVLFTTAVDSWYARSRESRKLWVFWALAASFLSAAAYTGSYVVRVRNDEIFNYFWVLAAVLVMTAGMILMTGFMKKRTHQCIEWMGHLAGLRDFIETAELDRMKALAEDQPQLFYHIMPYAYVFGLSDVFAEKLKDLGLAAPDWYVTDRQFTFFDYYIFNRCLMGNMAQAASTLSVPEPPKPSSGDGGGFGGGSFGGGGFSGGGFGGGGGGSW